MNDFGIEKFAIDESSSSQSSAFSKALTPTFLLLDPNEVRSVSCRSRAVWSLLDYWATRCPATNGRICGIPCRSDIEPWHIPDLLPNIMLVDISYDPFRIYYRLVGTHIVREAGEEFTGRYLDQLTLPDVVRTGYANQYAKITATRQPGIGVTFLSDRMDDDIYWIEYAICPLSDDGVTVNKCLAIECYKPLRAPSVTWPVAQVHHNQL